MITSEDDPRCFCADVAIGVVDTIGSWCLDCLSDCGLLWLMISDGLEIVVVFEGAEGMFGFDERSIR